MKKTSQYKNYLCGIAAILLLWAINACKKVDETYINYKNSGAVYSGNTYSYLQAQPGVFDSMLLVINRLPEIADTLKNKKGTLFAMTNSSFSITLDNVNQARRDSVPQLPALSYSTMDTAVLKKFLCRYIFPDEVSTSQLSIDATDGLFFRDVIYRDSMHMLLQNTNASGFEGGGPKTILFSDPRGSKFNSNWVRVYTITVDIKTNNGFVHLLSPGHNFGFGNDFIRALNTPPVVE